MPALASALLAGHFGVYLHGMVSGYLQKLPHATCPPTGMALPVPGQWGASPFYEVFFI